jgi:hypothetical protein
MSADLPSRERLDEDRNDWILRSVSNSGLAAQGGMAGIGGAYCVWESAALTESTTILLVPGNRRHVT